MDVVPLMVGVPARRRAALRRLACVALAFCVLFLYAAMPWWYDDLAHRRRPPPPSGAPALWIPYLSVPVGLALLCLQYIAEVYLVVSRRELPFGLAADDRL